MERVVDRSEFLSDESAPPSSPDPQHIRNLDEFEFVQREAQPAKTDAEPEDDELDFCLFAPAPGESKAAGTVAKIRVVTPPPEDRDPGFVNPHRDESYYFAAPTTEEKENFAIAAVPGRDVIKRSHGAWPGSAYEWKVLHIRATKRERLALSRPKSNFSKLLDDVPQKRKRPGKKYRLKVRTKLAATKAQQKEKLKAAEVKQAAEREKRTRRNREKKVKKRQRDKAKKADVGAEGDDSMAD